MLFLRSYCFPSNARNCSRCDVNVDSSLLSNPTILVFYQALSLTLVFLSDHSDSVIYFKRWCELARSYERKSRQSRLIVILNLHVMNIKSFSLKVRTPTKSQCIHQSRYPRFSQRSRFGSTGPPSWAPK